MSKHEENTGQCLNCAYSLAQDDKFCAQCGQEVRAVDTSFAGFLRHFLSDYFTFDSKIARSFKPLLFTPGFLTSEFLKGRRVRYIAPIRMYIFISIAFFLMLSFKGDSRGVIDEETVFWNNFFGVHLPRLFFVFLPLFALILHLIHFRWKENAYVKHFVFSLHFHSFIFILAIAFLMVTELFTRLNLQEVNIYLAVVALILMVLYLFLAMRRVYRQRLAKTVFKTVLAVFGYALVLVGLSLLALLVLSAG